MTYDWILMIDGSPKYGLYVHNAVSDGGMHKEKPKRAKWTNQQAEYHALIFALERHVGYGESAIIFSDAELVVNQVNDEYKCRNPQLQILRGQVDQIIRVKRLKIKLLHILRDKNKAGIELDKIKDKEKKRPT